jgi:hypothetical protein
MNKGRDEAAEKRRMAPDTLNGMFERMEQFEGGTGNKAEGVEEWCSRPAALEGRSACKR